MHQIIHLTVGQIAIGTVVVLGIIYIVWFFERYPKWWMALEDKCPMFRFGDTRQKPVGGPPRVEFGARPRDPSDFMIQRGLDALRSLEMLADEDEDAVMESRIMVQMVWAQMWQAWADERREQFYDHMEGA